MKNKETPKNQPQLEHLNDERLETFIAKLKGLLNEPHSDPNFVKHTENLLEEMKEELARRELSL